jgi:ABC-type nitrate/sulfonate/bicarbonate transport system ATPase subunit
LNDARPAGEPGPLDVRITRKAFTAASGERLDVLRDLAFTLKHSEVGALVGPSGCGKTTTLRIVAGLDHDFDGSILRPPAGKLGMVFQDPRLLPWRTVEENVRLVAPSIAEGDLAALFAVLELEAHRAHFPGELSLGLARRVALARAFAVEPDLLLLDEPFVSLDSALAVRMREQLVSLVEKRATTTLLVTHDLEEAVRLADRVFLLSARPGKIVAEFPLATPRRERSEVEVAAMLSELSRRVNGRPAA